MHPSSRDLSYDGWWTMKTTTPIIPFELCLLLSPETPDFWNVTSNLTYKLQNQVFLKLQNTEYKLISCQTHEICWAKAQFPTDISGLSGFSCVYLSHASLHNLQACLRLQEVLLRYCRGEKWTKSLIDVRKKKEQVWQTSIWGG